MCSAANIGNRSGTKHENSGGWEGYESSGSSNDKRNNFMTSCLPLGQLVASDQPEPPPRDASIMPNSMEEELYHHVLWLCENNHPASWDKVRAVAWQLGKVAGMQGKEREIYKIRGRG